MANKLSYSQIKTYTECGYKYFLHYKKNLRSKYMHSALCYGSAVDESLNVLLFEKDLEKAEQKFIEVWSEQWINGVKTQLSISETLVYAERDFDEDLLHKDDLRKMAELGDSFQGFTSPLDYYYEIQEKKKTIGFDALEPHLKKYYNYTNWLCLYRKGLVMIRSYNKKVMPNIVEVLAVQHKFKLENSAGDEIVAIADLVVKWADGRIMLMDNKTSARDYEKDQAGRSQQLIIYWHQLKQQFNLSNSVGFIVMNKNIIKNKVKICSKCGYDGSGSRSRTCPMETPDIVVKRGKETPGMVRCAGEWLEHCSAECYIETIINEVTDHAEDHVLESLVDANQGIGSNYWYRNLSACKSGPIVCQFFKYCWKKDSSDIIEVAKKN